MWVGFRPIGAPEVWVGFSPIGAKMWVQPLDTLPSQNNYIAEPEIITLLCQQ